METTPAQASPGHASEVAWPFAILVLPVLCGLLGYAMCARSPDDPASSLIVCGIVLLVVGAVASLLIWRTLRRMRGQIAVLQQEAAATGQLQAAMAARSDTHRQLRHDVRGALSPALLTADRLLTNSDPSVRRAGEIMVHAVERAAALMADPPPEGKVSPPGHP